MQDFPNPCDRSTTIHYSTGSQLPIRFRAWSILGRLIHEEDLESDYHTEKSFVLDASELANGFYICQLLQGAAHAENILVKLDQP